jgi:hypothetical protein
MSADGRGELWANSRVKQRSGSANPVQKSHR